MSDNRSTNDLLLQVLEEQTKQGKALARLEGNIEARVGSLETTDRKQWYIHAAQAVLVASLATARKFGLI